MLSASRSPRAVAHSIWLCNRAPGHARRSVVRASLGHQHNVPLIPPRRKVRAQSAASLLTLTLDDTYDVEISYLSAQIEVLSSVRNQVLGLDDSQQVEQFLELPAVKHVLEDYRDLKEFILQECSADSQAALLATIAAGQEHVLTLRPEGDWKPQMHSLAEKLIKVQRFYDALGGIVGYQLKCLQLILDAKVSENQSGSYDSSSTSSTDQPSSSEFEEEVDYLVPQGPKFNKGDEGRELAVQAAGQGLRALPELAEIYPLGGAGDRLGLVCDDTGEPLPAAMLPYCGRPLLEGLIRDLTAREYLYYRTFGEQCTTPVAIMTSDAKGNHWRVQDLLETRNYFGRPKESFRLFCQPLVPVLEASTGVWVLPEALMPSMKPGGHGAIWKLMHDNGIFSWLQGSGVILFFLNPLLFIVDHVCTCV